MAGRKTLVGRWPDPGDNFVDSWQIASTVGAGIDHFVVHAKNHGARSITPVQLPDTLVPVGDGATGARRCWWVSRRSRV